VDTGHHLSADSVIRGSAPALLRRKKDDEIKRAKWRKQQKGDGPQVRLIGEGVRAPEKKRNCREER
jgi:hypothetical protein